MTRFPRFTVGIAVLSVLLLASGASAMDLRDKNNLRIGMLANHTPYFGFRFQSTVLAHHNGIPYVVYVGRQEIIGTHWLYFTTPDCTGTPVLPMDPQTRGDIIAHFTGIAPDGEFWMMQRTKMSQQTVLSYWLDAGGDTGEDANTCQPREDTGYRYWVSPVIPIGKLNTKFTPPYTIK